MLDFDGSLAPIVKRPEDARVLPGMLEVLTRLAERYAVVGVISGRPAPFLAEQLQITEPAREGQGRLGIFGLYGAQRLAQSGAIEVSANRALGEQLGEIAARARAVAPRAVIEEKGQSLALHWRSDPAAEKALTELAETARAAGLELRLGKRSVELFAPGASDKGSVVRELADGLSCACFIGDDLGDLAAFAALDELARAGQEVLRIAVMSEEVPEELARRADVRLDGPEQVRSFLEQLLVR